MKKKLPSAYDEAKEKGLTDKQILAGFGGKEARDEITGAKQKLAKTLSEKQILAGFGGKSAKVEMEMKKPLSEAIGHLATINAILKARNNAYSEALKKQQLLTKERDIESQDATRVESKSDSGMGSMGGGGKLIIAGILGVLAVKFFDKIADIIPGVIAGVKASGETLFEFMTVIGDGFSWLGNKLKVLEPITESDTWKFLKEKFDLGIEVPKEEATPASGETAKGAPAKEGGGPPPATGAPPAAGAPAAAGTSAAGTTGNADATKEGTPPAIMGNGKLGELSAKFESGAAGTSAVGFDEKGGTSYGKYQIATRTGTMDRFMDYLKKNNPEAYERLSKAGTADSGKKGLFAQEWKKLAKEGKLQAAEHEFIRITRYDAAIKLIKDAKLVDMINKSKALQDVMWSTSVQHGAGGAAIIFNNVYKEGISEQDLIKAIYDKRRTKFPNSSAEVRQSVLKRFDEEQQLALVMSNTKQIEDVAVADAGAKAAAKDKKAAYTGETLTVAATQPKSSKSAGNDNASSDSTGSIIKRMVAGVFTA